MNRFRKVMSVTAALTVCLTSLSLGTENVFAAINCGDANQNGTVNAADVAAVSHALLGKEKLSSMGYQLAELDLNERVDIVDELLLKRYTAKLIGQKDFPAYVPDLPPIPQGAVYASASGKSGASGTESDPYDIATAVTKIAAGETVYCAAGTYKLSSTLKIDESNSGTSSQRKTISSYNGPVIFDFSALSVSGSNRGVSMEGSYWHWYGITIQKAGDNGMILAGDENIIEMCVFQNNQDTGLQLSRANTKYSSLDQWPTNNLILNCTSRNNCDDATMENADGFAAKLTCGNGNIFDGCMGYNNSDDGWDLYAKSETGPIGVVTIKNCIAFRNGYTEDGRGYGDCDGNGFKLGGAGVGTAHVLENCMSFENLHHGFTDNNNPKFGSLKNCTSYQNAVGGSKANFQMDRCTAGSFSGLLSYIGKSSCGSDKFNGNISNAVFYNSKKYYSVTSSTSVSNSKAGSETSSPKDSDFASVSVPAMNQVDFHTYWRNSDGSITTKGFMMPTASAYSNLGARFKY